MRESKPPFHSSGSLDQADLIGGQGPASPINLGDSWGYVVSGQWSVTRTEYTDAYCHMRLRVDSPGSGPRGRVLRVLERVLLGEAPKAIAVDMEVGQSTISGTVKAALKSIGVCTRANGVPVGLMAMYQTHAGKIRQPRSFARFGYGGDETCVLVSVERPDCSPITILSTAEMSVLRYCVEGCTHQQIAEARSTSVRTIANQIGSTYSKLRVSGRLQLVTLLLESGLDPDGRAGVARYDGGAVRAAFRRESPRSSATAEAQWGTP